MKISNEKTLLKLSERKSNIEDIPFVSISCVVYNHEKFIKDALEGFLMQETNFMVEILIHDDASQDNTQNIIKEYQEKFPHIIKPIYQTQNQYSQGIKPGRFNMERAVGKYYAICEGDDYWTDPLKLQRQVDFLEKNPKYGATAENAQVIYDNGETASFGIRKSRTLTMEELVRCRQFATASLVYRNNLERPIGFGDLVAGDTPLAVLIQNKAPIYYRNIISSVYRRGRQGVTATFHEPEMKKKLIDMNLFLDKFTENKYSRIFEKKIKGLEVHEKGSKPDKMFSYLDKLLYRIYLKMVNAKQYFYFDIDNLHYFQKIYYRIFK